MLLGHGADTTHNACMDFLAHIKRIGGVYEAGGARRLPNPLRPRRPRSASAPRTHGRGTPNKAALDDNLGAPTSLPASRTRR